MDQNLEKAISTTSDSVVWLAGQVDHVKKELETKKNSELLSYCLKLAKFKKENKELLSFLLFESHDINAYINNVKDEVSEAFNSRK